MKNEYSIDELAAAVDRIERKLDLVLFDEERMKKTVYNFDCTRLLECPLAGKGCWLCVSM